LKKITLVAAVLLLAAFLRFYRLGAQSFWNDEGNSARLAERSFALIVAGAAGDIHPPGYYLLLATWRAFFGQSEFALRGLSALAGLLLVAIVYRLGKQYFDSPAALAAAFLAAIHPALIYYSQEARMYSLVAMWGAGLFLATTHERTRTERANTARVRPFNPQHSLAIAVLTTAGLYTHYAFAFVLIALTVVIIVRAGYYAVRLRAADPEFDVLGFVISYLFYWFTFQFIGLLLFAPWLPVAYRQLTTWPSAREYPPVSEALTGMARWLILGPTAESATTTIAFLGAAALVVFTFLRLRRQLAISLIWLAVPAGLSLGFGLFSPAFAKFLIVAVPAVCVLLGNGAALSVTSRRARWLGLAMVPLVIASAASLNNLYFNPAFARADYRGLARYLDSIAQPGDGILLNAPNQWEVFTYYHPDEANVFPLARTRPLNIPEQIKELETIAASHRRLFVLYWGDAQSDPDRVIESWLNAHTFKAWDQWYAEVRLAAYAVPQTGNDPQTRIDAVFGDQIRLEGYALNANAFAPGDILQLTLFWRTESPVSSRYKVFVHLAGDPASPPVAQHDDEPGGGLSLTTTWSVGQTVADNHGVYLPLDLPPGQYALRVGLYGVEDERRLRLEAGGDALTLTTITVQ
jgi:4-amino-4-deoxy-L-arabinose transferase-like glycosyltransferase